METGGLMFLKEFFCGVEMFLILDLLGEAAAASPLRGD